MKQFKAYLIMELNKDANGNIVSQCPVGCRSDKGMANDLCVELTNMIVSENGQHARCGACIPTPETKCDVKEISLLPKCLGYQDPKTVPEYNCFNKDATVNRTEYAVVDFIINGRVERIEYKEVCDDEESITCGELPE